MKLPKNIKSLVGRSFPDLCPSFSQEKKWEHGSGRNFHKRLGRVLVTFHVGNRPPKGTCYAKIKVDLALFKFVWDTAEKFHVFTELEVVTRGWNALSFTMEGCVLNHQAKKGDTEYDYWGQNISFLKALAKKYAVTVFFEDSTTQGCYTVVFDLDKNLTVTKAVECGDGG